MFPVHDQHYTIVVLLQVNVVPIIAKADTIAKSELKQFKEKVREHGRILSWGKYDMSTAEQYRINLI